MVGFIIISISLIVSLTFIGVRLSIAFMFWISKKHKNAMHVFKMHFPYYIIALGMSCALVIMALEFHIIAIIYCGTIYLIALLIWKFLLRPSRKTKTSLTQNTKSSQL